MILLIKNGHVINPATETDEVADILAEDGKVVKMEKNIKAKADRVIRGRSRKRRSRQAAMRRHTADTQPSLQCRTQSRW